MEDIEIEYLDEYKDLVLPGIKTSGGEERAATSASLEQASTRPVQPRRISSDSSGSSSIDPDIFQKLFDGKFLDDELLNESGSNLKSRSQRSLSPSSSESNDALDALYNRQSSKTNTKSRERLESFDSLDELSDALMGTTRKLALHKPIPSSNSSRNTPNLLKSAHSIKQKSSDAKGLLGKPSSSSAFHAHMQTQAHPSRSAARRNGNSSKGNPLIGSKKRAVTVIKVPKSTSKISKYESKNDPLLVQSMLDYSDSDSSYEIESDYYGEDDSDEEGVGPEPKQVIDISTDSNPSTSEAESVTPVVSEDEGHPQKQQDSTPIAKNERLQLYLNNLNCAETPPSNNKYSFAHKKSRSSEKKSTASADKHIDQVNDSNTNSKSPAEEEKQRARTSCKKGSRALFGASVDDDNLTYESLERFSLNLAEEISNIDAERSIEFEKRSASNSRSNSFSKLREGLSLFTSRKLTYSNDMLNKDEPQMHALRRARSDNAIPKRKRGRPPKNRAATTDDKVPMSPESKVPEEESQSTEPSADDGKLVHTSSEIIEQSCKHIMGESNAVEPSENNDKEVSSEPTPKDLIEQSDDTIQGLPSEAIETLTPLTVIAETESLPRKQESPPKISPSDVASENSPAESNVESTDSTELQSQTCTDTKEETQEEVECEINDSEKSQEKSQAAESDDKFVETVTSSSMDDIKPSEINPASGYLSQLDSSSDSFNSTECEIASMPQSPSTFEDLKELELQNRVEATVQETDDATEDMDAEGNTLSEGEELEEQQIETEAGSIKLDASEEKTDSSEERTQSPTPSEDQQETDSVRQASPDSHISQTISVIMEDIKSQINCSSPDVGAITQRLARVRMEDERQSLSPAGSITNANAVSSTIATGVELETLLESTSEAIVHNIVEDLESKESQPDTEKELEEQTEDLYRSDIMSETEKSPDDDNADIPSATSTNGVPCGISAIDGATTVEDSVSIGVKKTCKKLKKSMCAKRRNSFESLPLSNFVRCRNKKKLSISSINKQKSLTALSKPSKLRRKRKSETRMSLGAETSNTDLVDVEKALNDIKIDEIIDAAIEALPSEENVAKEDNGNVEAKQVDNISVESSLPADKKATKKERRGFTAEILELLKTFEASEMESQSSTRSKLRSPLTSSTNKTRGNAKGKLKGFGGRKTEKESKSAVGEIPSKNVLETETLAIDTKKDEVKTENTRIVQRGRKKKRVHWSKRVEVTTRENATTKSEAALTEEPSSLKTEIDTVSKDPIDKHLNISSKKVRVRLKNILHSKSGITLQAGEAAVTANPNTNQEKDPKTENLETATLESTNFEDTHVKEVDIKPIQPEEEPEVASKSIQEKCSISDHVDAETDQSKLKQADKCGNQNEEQAASNCKKQRVELSPSESTGITSVEGNNDHDLDLDLLSSKQTQLQKRDADDSQLDVKARARKLLQQKQPTVSKLATREPPPPQMVKREIAITKPGVRHAKDPISIEEHPVQKRRKVDSPIGNELKESTAKGTMKSTVISSQEPSTKSGRHLFPATNTPMTIDNSVIITKTALGSTAEKVKSTPDALPQKPSSSINISVSMAPERNPSSTSPSKKILTQAETGKMLLSFMTSSGGKSSSNSTRGSAESKPKASKTVAADKRKGLTAKDTPVEADNAKATVSSAVLKTVSQGDKRKSHSKAAEKPENPNVSSISGRKSKPLPIRFEEQNPKTQKKSVEFTEPSSAGMETSAQSKTIQKTDSRKAQKKVQAKAKPQEVESKSKNVQAEDLPKTVELNPVEDKPLESHLDEPLMKPTIQEKSSSEGRLPVTNFSKDSTKNRHSRNAKRDPSHSESTADATASTGQSQKAEKHASQTKPRKNIKAIGCDTEFKSDSRSKAQTPQIRPEKMPVVAETKSTKSSNSRKRNAPASSAADSSNIKRPRQQHQVDTKPESSDVFPVRFTAAASLLAGQSLQISKVEEMRSAKAAVSSTLPKPTKDAEKPATLFPVKMKLCKVRLNKSVVRNWLRDSAEQQAKNQAAQQTPSLPLTLPLDSPTVVQVAPAAEITSSTSTSTLTPTTITKPTVEEKKITEKVATVPQPVLRVKTEQELAGRLRVERSEPTATTSDSPATMPHSSMATQSRQVLSRSSSSNVANPTPLGTNNNNNSTDNTNIEINQNAKMFGATNMFTFLYPSRFQRSMWNVGLDYCCPNLDGPMDAIDPTRLHATTEVPVLELPQFMVISTKIISKLDKNVPAKVRAQFEQMAAKRKTAPSSVQTMELLHATSSAAASPSCSMPLSIYTSSQVSIQQTPPISTPVAAIAPTQAAAVANAAALGKPQLPGVLQMPPIYPHDKKKIELQNRLLHFDHLIQMVTRRASQMSISDRQIVIEKIVKTSSLLAIDIDVGTKLLEAYVNYMNAPVAKPMPKPIQVGVTTPSSAMPVKNQKKAKATQSHPVSSYRVMAGSGLNSPPQTPLGARVQQMSSAAPSTAVSGAQSVNRYPMPNRMNAAAPSPSPSSASLSLSKNPIYDKGKNIIGYQVLANDKVPPEVSPQQLQAETSPASSNMLSAIDVSMRSLTRERSDSTIAFTPSPAQRTYVRSPQKQNATPVSSSMYGSSGSSSLQHTSTAAGGSIGTNPNMYIVSQDVAHEDECILPDEVSTTDDAALKTVIKDEVDNVET